SDRLRALGENPDGAGDPVHFDWGGSVQSRVTASKRLRGDRRNVLTRVAVLVLIPALLVVSEALAGAAVTSPAGHHPVPRHRVTATAATMSTLPVYGIAAGC